MKKGLLLFFLFPLTLFAKVGQDGDFQIWNENVVNLKLDPKVTFAISNEYRWGDNASKIYYKHLQGKLLCKVSPRLSLHPGYLMMWFRASNKWVIVYEPLFEFTVQLLKNQYVEVKNRNRVGYNVIPGVFGGKNAWSYRNRTHFHIPVTIHGYQFKLFVGDEIFFLQGRGFSQNRVMGGGDASAK
ncbi:DUF2490 domain-containing protein [Simkania sp.]|uniref:DUF2490 domain-containing protein n=1 Tax=Simkania sp. TaxID=34094 RepID=UPI003B51BCA6